MHKKETIVLLVPILAHYRRDVYKHLANSSKFEFLFYGGKNYENIKKIDDLPGNTFEYVSFKLFRHRFYYLKGAVKKILQSKPGAIICSGVDFHLMHTLVLFFIYRIVLRRKFYWWSQGTKGNQGKIGWFLRKMVYRLSSGVMLYSKAGYNNLLKMKIKASKLQVLNNCLNNEDYGYLNYDIQNNKSNDELRILFSGRISNKVDLEVLIRAIGYLKTKYNQKISCYILGKGDVNYYSNIAKANEVEDLINFLGAKYSKEAHSYFLDSDLFVYPGGIGLSIAHALSFGLPVITTDNFKLHNPEIELLKKDFNGDFYRDGNFEDLANIIIKWGRLVEKNQNSFAENCIKTITDYEYLPEKVGDRVLAFLEKDMN